jgi:hypothetical protein
MTAGFPVGSGVDRKLLAEEGAARVLRTLFKIAMNRRLTGEHDYIRCAECDLISGIAEGGHSVAGLRRGAGCRSAGGGAAGLGDGHDRVEERRPAVRMVAAFRCTTVRRHARRLVAW